MSYQNGQKPGAKHLYEVPENLSADRPLQQDPKANENLKIATHFEREDSHISYDNSGIRFSDGSHTGIRAEEDANLVRGPEAVEDPVIMTDPVTLRNLITVTIIVGVILLISIAVLVVISIL
ncbi:MAG: hypothetical protein J6X33_02375 [Clostridiales bacterium]|nr:hypothetical protein [Clostridiales bacterium]